MDFPSLTRNLKYTIMCQNEYYVWKGHKQKKQCGHNRPNQQGLTQLTVTMLVFFTLHNVGWVKDLFLATKILPQSTLWATVNSPLHILNWQPREEHLDSVWETWAVLVTSRTAKHTYLGWSVYQGFLLMYIYSL